MRTAPILLALVAACSSAPHTTAPPPGNVQPPASPEVVPGSPTQSSTHGKVCKLGNGDTPRVTPVTCGAGLSCCYPCGESGCDFTCMTDAECAEKRP